MLAGLIAPQVGQMSQKQRRQILRHIETCKTCQDVRRHYMTAAQLLAGIAPIMPPATLQQDVLGRLIGQLPPPATAGSGGSPRRSPPPASRSSA